jgi:hypothetical protein
MDRLRALPDSMAGHLIVMCVLLEHNVLEMLLTTAVMSVNGPLVALQLAILVPLELITQPFTSPRVFCVLLGISQLLLKPHLQVFAPPVPLGLTLWLEIRRVHLVLEESINRPRTQPHASIVLQERSLL